LCQAEFEERFESKHVFLFLLYFLFKIEGQKMEQAPHLDEEQRKLLLSLLNSGPEAAAKTLKSKLTASPGSAAGLLDAFVQFLFSASDSIKTETALVYCLWLACGGTNPNTVIQKIQSNSAGKSNACGRVWKSGDLAYNCADCQFDDTW
jgi:hypothetical protein